MRLSLVMGLMAGVVLSGTQVAVAGVTAPAPSPDATHPVAMQQAGNEVATASLKPTQPKTGKAAAPLAPAASNLQREIFGFALASSLADSTVGYPSWDFSLLSTVAFFGLHINDDGTIAADQGLTEWNSADLTNLLSAAHPHGTRVVLTIIEQDFGAGTPHMCAALANRATVVSQTVAQVSAKSVDGVNIDFEGLNGTCPNGRTARSMMTDLANQLRTALPAGSYLSVDTYASSASDPLGFFDVSGLNAYVDSFFVMAYDLEYSNWSRPPASCTSFCLGPTGPLARYYYSDTSTATQYQSAVGASKVILGVPYYGRKSCVASVAPNAAPTGTVTADTYLSASTETSSSQVRPGSYATHRDANDPGGQERWDTWYNPTLGCTRELYWDDTVSLGLKYDLVNNDALRGVGIWNLNYGGGANELWSALAGHFRRCTSVTVAASPSAPQPVGTAIQATASAGGCLNPLYQFWMRPASGPWTMVQDYSSTSTFNWTSTAIAGGYYIGVHVRDSASATAFDSVVSIPYTLTPLACASVTESAAPPSSSPSGTPVTVTGTASGCPNPVYEFWMLAQGSHTWRMIQGYSSNAAYLWNSTGALAGTEQFGVWVRDASSSAAYDAFTGIPYTVATPSCASVTMTASPPSPSAHGTGVRVMFTAVAAGCTNANPRYEFWMLAQGSATWQLVQGYSTGAAFTWNTNGAPAGTERFGVWVRDAGSSAAYDTYAAIAYTVS